MVVQVKRCIYVWAFTELKQGCAPHTSPRSEEGGTALCASALVVIISWQFYMAGYPSYTYGLNRNTGKNGCDKNTGEEMCEFCCDGRISYPNTYQQKAKQVPLIHLQQRSAAKFTALRNAALLLRRAAGILTRKHSLWSTSEVEPCNTSYARKNT